MQGRCKKCDKWDNLECHHLIFGNGFRKLADKYGLTVNICRECHYKVHNTKKGMNWSRQEGQKMFEEKHGDREEFMRVFGKNWLD